jgi:hypothetical protein
MEQESLRGGTEQIIQRKMGRRYLLLRQDDSVVQPRDMNGLGLTLALRIR